MREQGAQRLERRESKTGSSSHDYIQWSFWRLQRARGQFDQRLVLFRAGDEIEGAKIAGALGFRGILVVDDLDQQTGSFVAARTPHDDAARGRIPDAACLGQQSLEKLVPLAVGGEAQGLEMPAIAAVILHGQLRPEPRRFG